MEEYEDGPASIWGIAFGGKDTDETLGKRVILDLADLERLGATHYRRGIADRRAPGELVDRDGVLEELFVEGSILGEELVGDLGRNGLVDSRLGHCAVASDVLAQGERRVRYGESLCICALAGVARWIGTEMAVWCPGRAEERSRARAGGIDAERPGRGVMKVISRAEDAGARCRSIRYRVHGCSSDRLSRSPSP